jgi:hypothetical protein
MWRAPSARRRRDTGAAQAKERRRYGRWASEHRGGKGRDGSDIDTIDVVRTLTLGERWQAREVQERPLAMAQSGRESRGRICRNGSGVFTRYGTARILPRENQFR